MLEKSCVRRLYMTPAMSLDIVAAAFSELK